MKTENYTKIIFCIILVYCCFSIFNTPSLEEDSYIYFRFAENIASGNGYVFNQAGERIEGCSSITWLFLLVCFKLLGCNVLATAQLLGIFLGSCSLFVIYKISCCFIQLPRWRLLPVLLTAFSVPFLLRNQMGLEDPLYSFVFLSLVLVCLHEKSFKYWPAVFFILVITRPEGMFMAPALLPVFYLHRNRRREITRGIALVVLLFVLLFSLRIFYFHDFLPSPFYHKVVPDKWKYGLIYAGGFLKDYYVYFFFLPLMLFVFKKNNWTLQRLIVLAFMSVQCLWIILARRMFFPLLPSFYPRYAACFHLCHFRPAYTHPGRFPHNQGNHILLFLRIRTCSTSSPCCKLGHCKESPILLPATSNLFHPNRGTI